MTPATKRVMSLDEETLLGMPKKRKPRRTTVYGCIFLVLALLFFAYMRQGSASSSAPTQPVASPTTNNAKPEGERLRLKKTGQGDPLAKGQKRQERERPEHPHKGKGAGGGGAKAKAE